MIRGIAHVCISSRDLALTERFYCSGLGFRKVFDFIRGGAVIGFYLEVSPKSYIEVFRQDQIDTQAKSPIRHICLEVDQIDDVSGRLKSQGYDVTDKKLGSDQGWQVWTTDPSGVRIEFHQYTEKSSQLTGANCVLG
jgi:lactoylglutathione lyase/glyoxylase I family protein